MRTCFSPRYIAWFFRLHVWLLCPIDLFALSVFSSLRPVSVIVRFYVPLASCAHHMGRKSIMSCRALPHLICSDGFCPISGECFASAGYAQTSVLAGDLYTRGLCPHLCSGECTAFAGFAQTSVLASALHNRGLCPTPVLSVSELRSGV